MSWEWSANQGLLAEIAADQRISRPCAGQIKLGIGDTIRINYQNVHNRYGWLVSQPPRPFLFCTHHDACLLLPPLAPQHT